MKKVEFISKFHTHTKSHIQTSYCLLYNSNWNEISWKFPLCRKSFSADDGGELVSWERTEMMTTTLKQLSTSLCFVLRDWKLENSNETKRNSELRKLCNTRAFWRCCWCFMGNAICKLKTFLHSQNSLVCLPLIICLIKSKTFHHSTEHREIWTNKIPSLPNEMRGRVCSPSFPLFILHLLMFCDFPNNFFPNMNIFSPKFNFPFFTFQLYFSHHFCNKFRSTLGNFRVIFTFFSIIWMLSAVARLITFSDDADAVL